MTGPFLMSGPAGKSPCSRDLVAQVDGLDAVLPHIGLRRWRRGILRQLVGEAG